MNEDNKNAAYFRKYASGDLIAVFPNRPDKVDGPEMVEAVMEEYGHFLPEVIGADLDFVLRNTTPITDPEECGRLATAVASFGLTYIEIIDDAAATDRAKNEKRINEAMAEKRRDIEARRKRAAAEVTPGPWRVGDAGHTIFGPKMEGAISPKIVATGLKPANARAIVAAVNAADNLRAAIAAIVYAAPGSDEQKRAIEAAARLID